MKLKVLTELKKHKIDLKSKYILQLEYNKMAIENKVRFLKIISCFFKTV